MLLVHVFYRMVGWRSSVASAVRGDYLRNEYLQEEEADANVAEK